MNEPYWSKWDHADKAVPIKDYIETKIEILAQLAVILDDKKLKHIRSLESETEVDRFAHTLIIGDSR